MFCSGKLKTLVLVVFLLFPALLLAQTSFTFVAEETEIIVDDFAYHEFHCTLTNTSDVSHDYKILKSDDNLLEGWTGSMCTSGGCLPAFIDSVAITLGPGESDTYISIDITSTTTYGTGVVGIHVADMVDAEDSIDMDFTMTVNDPASVGEGSNLAESFELLPVYPNPFNSTAKIVFNLDRSSEVTMEVFDLQGRRLATLMNAFVTEGRHEVAWQAAETVSSGTYLIKLSSQGKNLISRATLIR